MYRLVAGGSSPLARGLLSCGSWPPWTVGIIPARAGFTRPVDPGACIRPDHPRSRGVYGLETTDQFIFQGSSPLARGLRDPPILIAEVGRIIPARAGFTSSSSWSAKATGDHPRSRGVYSSTPLPATVGTGSSPLARGLHLLGSVELVLERIIPARAGFTRFPDGPAP